MLSEGVCSLCQAAELTPARLYTGLMTPAMLVLPDSSSDVAVRDWTVLGFEGRKDVLEAIFSL